VTTKLRELAERLRAATPAAYDAQTVTTLKEEESKGKCELRYL
jgi:hypothetical protein